MTSAWASPGAMSVHRSRIALVSAGSGSVLQAAFLQRPAEDAVRGPRVHVGAAALVVLVADGQGQAGVGDPDDLPSDRVDGVVVHERAGTHPSCVHDDLRGEVEHVVQSCDVTDHLGGACCQHLLEQVGQVLRHLHQGHGEPKPPCIAGRQLVPVRRAHLPPTAAAHAGRGRAGSGASR